MPVAERQSMHAVAAESPRSRSAVDDRFANLAAELDQAFVSCLPFLETSLQTDTQRIATEQPFEVNFEGELIVSGYLEATVRSEKGTLSVTSRGTLRGNISVRNAIIHGLVHGEISATGSVELSSSARVIGNIQTSALQIQPGAIFEGCCRVVDDSRAGSKGANDLRSTFRSRSSLSAEFFAPDLLAAAG